MKKRMSMILPALLVLLLLALYLGVNGGTGMTGAVANGGQIGADSGFGAVLADEMGQIAESFQKIQFMMIAIIVFMGLYSLVLLASLLFLVRKRRAKMKKSVPVVRQMPKPVPKPVRDNANVSRRSDLRAAIKVEGTYTGNRRSDKFFADSFAIQNHKKPEPIEEAADPQNALKIEEVADVQNALKIEGVADAQDALTDEVLELIEADPAIESEPDTETGNLFAEALRYATGADIAFINSGGIRGPIHCDPITEADLSQSFPFGDTVMILGLTEAQIRSVLEHSADMASERDGRDLYTSGITVELDAAMSVGERVGSVTLANGEPLRDGTEYIVAMNEYIANGGDGYDMLAALPKMSEGQTVVQAVLEYATEIGAERMAV